RLTAAGIDAKLWSEEDALYVDYDLGAERHVGARTAAGLSPLHAGIPTAERARQMVGTLAASRVEVNGGESWAVTSLSPDDPGFLPARYWRGPIWPILNWALQRGLDRYGYGTLAAQVRGALIDLASREGFWEHYSPLTGKGQGGESFAWTAGLVLDVLATEMESGKEDVRMKEEHPKAVEPTSKSETERRE
ncbi:MAG: trehalase family glycosidase, partial [Gaiellaceae bacterium]